MCLGSETHLTNFNFAIQQYQESHILHPFHFQEICLNLNLC